MSSFSTPASSAMQGDQHSSHLSSQEPTAFVPATSFRDTGMEEVQVVLLHFHPSDQPSEGTP